jgi:hypothetical protein
MGVSALAVVGVLLAGAANAQGGFGGGQMPPEIAKKIKAWQKFGEDHKKLQTLGDQVYQIGEVNHTAGYELDKKQAAAVLKVVNSNKAKTSLSEEEAGAISKALTAALTAKQIKKMTTIETPRQKMQKNRGGMGGGGGARPGGGGGAPGGRPGGFTFPDPPAKGWNPLNPDSLPFEAMRPRAKESMNKFMADLQARAK